MENVLDFSHAVCLKVFADTEMADIREGVPEPEWDFLLEKGDDLKWEKEQKRSSSLNMHCMTKEQPRNQSSRRNNAISCCVRSKKNNIEINGQPFTKNQIEIDIQAWWGIKLFPIHFAQLPKSKSYIHMHVHRTNGEGRKKKRNQMIFR